MRNKILILILIIVVAIAVSAAAGYFYFLQNVKTPLGPASAPKKAFAVLPGQGVKEIAKKLEDEKIIGDDFYFEIYAWLSDTEKRFQAGEYELTPAMNIPQIVGILISGKAISQEVRVTVPEGVTFKEIVSRFENSGFKIGDDLPKAGDYKDEFSFLADSPDDASLEGFLFPDTYNFFKKSSADDIFKKFLDNFNKKLSSNLREEIKRQNKKIHETVTMASVIEKEVAKDPDRAIVSGILWKRLAAGMPLQADATICYAKLADFKGCYPIYRDDLDIDSLYNTYKYKGLPPGPISNPGLAAIEAAIFPQESDYWFYLSKPDGETVFSKTLDEHNKAKALYLR